MGPLDLIKHPLLFTGITVPEFLRWYFWEQPIHIIRTYRVYFRAFMEIFSFGFLMRTLFSPWKQIRNTTPIRGFNISAMSQALTLSVLSRTIGFFLRSVTVIFGLGFMVILSCGFLAFFFVWIAFPILFWICVSYIISALF